MPGSDGNNTVRSNGAFDAFASQAATSADLLNLVKDIAIQSRIIARNTETYRTYNSSNAGGYDRERVFRDRYERQFESSYSKDKRNRTSSDDQGSRSESSARYRSSAGYTRRAARTVEEGILDGLSEGLLGFNWRDALSKGLNNFAKNLGVNLEDLPGELSKQLTKQGLDAFKQTNAGKAMMSKISTWKGKLFQELGPEFIKMFQSSGGSSSGAFNFFSAFFKGAGSAGAGAGASGASASGAGAMAGSTAGAMTTAGAGGTVASGAGAGGAMAGVGAGAGSGIAAAGPYAIIILLIIKKIEELIEAATPGIEGAKKLFEAAKASFNRYSDERKKYLKLAADRIAADTKVLITEPFNILKDSAEQVEKAWDSALTVISATQGYTKAQTQDLMAYMAQRLRDEDLSSVVNAASIIEKLPDVLKEGLSGRVAEEFTYIASKLNAAIPTQDFFQYASSYSSIVANLVKNGKSQEDAIEYANKQLEQFASNVLYANRSIAGGTSTGLKNAQSLFEQSVRISQASRTYDISTISGVLTSVAGIVGAIAPDLATSITDAVYNAAVGGNETSLVALRSLAGINASNTQFLRALVENPQKLFEQLFRNLANMQNMSADAYMEVADQVSQVFGLSRDAFARVDFSYIADAIHAVDTSNTALAQNMAMLQSGQTTLTKDQLRNQQINQYMLEEGLALVLDSEVGRAIQQHMWDEQLARQIIEAEYGVNIVGSALQFIEGIKLAIDNIITVLSPFGMLKKIVNGMNTVVEAVAQQTDLQTSLLATAVGGSKVDTSKLVSTYLSRNVDLNLTQPYVQLVGENSIYQQVNDWNRLFNMLSNPSGQSTLVLSWLNSWFSTKGVSDVSRSALQSQYAFGTVSKSQATQQMQGLFSNYVAPVSYQVEAAADTIQNAASATDAMRKYINSLTSETASSQAFEDWIAGVESKGVANWEAALTELGYTEQQLRDLYEHYQAQAVSQQQAERSKSESAFWTAGKSFWTDTWSVWSDKWNDWSTATSTALNTTIPNSINDVKSEVVSSLSDVSSILNTWDREYWIPWKESWTAQYADNLYAEKFGGVDYQALLKGEKDSTSTAIDRLATALVTGVTDLSDPAVQTNTILAQILLLLTQLTQQNAMPSGGQPSLGTTLMELALGRSK